MKDTNIITPDLPEGVTYEDVWAELKRKCIPNDDLRWIIITCTKEFKEEAWEILKQVATEEDLRSLIKLADDEYRAKAQELLRQKGAIRRAKEAREKLKNKSSFELAHFLPHYVMPPQHHKKSLS